MKKTLIVTAMLAAMLAGYSWASQEVDAAGTDASASVQGKADASAAAPGQSDQNGAAQYPYQNQNN